MKKIYLSIAVLVASFALIISAQAQELIVNGDFEDPLTFVNTGPGGGTPPPTEIGYFEEILSDYYALNPANIGSWTLGPEQYYTIGTDPNDYHSAWWSFGDNTSGTGNMMIVNAACMCTSSGGCSGYCIGATAPDQRIWYQTVGVLPFTQYDFSYWWALTYPQNPPILRTSINGINDDNTTSGTPAIWYERAYALCPSAATSATIAFYDLLAYQNGDDFALDDISLAADSDCSTSAALIAGQTTSVGTVFVSYYNGSLYVTFKVDDPWCATEFHLDVAASYEEIPQRRGNPIPGHFEFMFVPEVCVNEYTFGPIEGEMSGVIAAHAKVMDTTGYDCIDPTTEEPTTCYRMETAWGEGDPFPGMNWAMYFDYDFSNCVDDCEIPE